MMTVKSYGNMFSSVAATVATASFRANNFGTAVAVPFFVLISIICIFGITLVNVITGALLITLLALISIIMQYDISCESKHKKMII